MRTGIVLYCAGPHVQFRKQQLDIASLQMPVASDVGSHSGMHSTAPSVTFITVRMNDLVSRPSTSNQMTAPPATAVGQCGKVAQPHGPQFPHLPNGGAFANPTNV